VTATAKADGALEPDASTTWHRWVAPAIIVLLVGMILYLCVTIWSGLDRLHAALSTFPVATHVPAVLGLIIFGWLVRAARWHYYTRTLGWPVPLGANVLAFCASFAFTATPGKAGEVVKAALLRSRFGVSMADTAGVLLIERLGDVMAVLILGLGGLALLPNGWAIFIVSMIGLAGIVAFLTNERLYHPFFERLARAPRLTRVASKLLQLVDTGRALLRPRPLVIGLLLAVIAWGCEAIAFWVILDGLGLSVPKVAAFSVYALSTVVGAISMLPGGIGGVEATMLVFLAVLRVAQGPAIAAVLLIRLSTLYFVSCLGVLFMGLWWLMARRSGVRAARAS
jgi:glycosyltransferase 2 family protein